MSDVTYRCCPTCHVSYWPECKPPGHAVPCLEHNYEEIMTHYTEEDFFKELG